MFKFLQWLKPKPKVAPKSISTQSANEPCSRTRDVIKDLVSKGKIDHDKLNALCSLFFAVKIHQGYYRFKGKGPYGVLLTISRVDFVTMDDTDKLIDVILGFTEIGLGSSLCVTLSVKELYEFLDPVTIEQPRPKKEASL